MNQYFIYNHRGSGNHGCEALVRTILNLFQNQQQVLLLSEYPQEDRQYGVDNIAPVQPATTGYSKMSLAFLKAYTALKLKGDYVRMDALMYRKPIEALSAEQVELSVGGDVYCYEDYKKHILLHKMIVARGCKTVLLGCSLEEKLFDDPEFLEDMSRYDYISARESMTYEMLQKAGLKKIGLTPDSAFLLNTENLPLRKGFVAGQTVGINLSPLVVRKEVENGIVFENFVRLIQYILDNTDCSVALIPHVVWQNNDDRTVLKQLYQVINCPDRVVLIEDHNCMQLKGFISRCRFFVGARTHATIAAYSSCVPTLVLGYSVKSRGIAKDLFGADENYVIPVETLKSPETMSNAFQWMMDHETEIRDRLTSVMPEYIDRARELPQEVERALEKE